MYDEEINKIAGTLDEVEIVFKAVPSLREHHIARIRKAIRNGR